MPAPLLRVSLSAIDLEQVQLFLAEHWHKACADPLGYAFWALIWGCAFVATFLLIRMFFTGWGDKNVTEKTLALSILVHGVIAMLSTTVMLATEQEPPHELRTRIRKVHVEGDQLAPRDPTRGQGLRPKWDAVAALESQGANRLEKPARLEDQNPDRTPFDTHPGIELPVSDQAAPVEAPVTNPEPVRARERLPAARNITSAVEHEQTAVSRPEARVKVDRKATTPSPSNQDDSPRRERMPSPGREADSDSDARGSSANLVDADPVPRGGKSRVADSVSNRAPTSAPTIEEVDSTPGGDPVAAPRPRGSGSKFTRTGRDAAPRDKQDPDESTSPGRPQRPPESATLDGSREVASRTPRDTGPGDLSPQVSREGGRSPGRGTVQGKLPETYRLRGGDMRREAARKYGATRESEQAVAASLAWLARQQNADGSWPTLESTLGDDPEPPRFTATGDPKEESRMLAERRQSGLQAESGLTALAILAYLGAGHTPEDEEYGKTVARGLYWLVSQQYRHRSKDGESQRVYDGFLGGKANRFARMYCHGMATIALGEAYGMTRDPALREPLQRALQHTVRMQYPDGSWRYSDWRNQESPTGDMSLFGWQLMALKSGQTAGIRLPDQGLERALDKAQKFLAARRAEIKGRGESRHGGLASYRTGSGERPKPAMTAEALFCWQLLGVAPTEPAVLEAVEYLRKRPPRMASPDLYYWYYATLALYQQGGAPFEEWNEALLDALVEDQRQEGEFAGSWNPRRPWGDFGGRVFSTAMSTLCLEVYYRYLPLYQTGADTGKTPLR